MKLFVDSIQKLKRALFRTTRGVIAIQLGTLCGATLFVLWDRWFIPRFGFLEYSVLFVPLLLPLIPISPLWTLYAASSNGESRKSRWIAFLASLLLSLVSWWTLLVTSY